jgi:hypothetical protein
MRFGLCLAITGLLSTAGVSHAATFIYFDSQPGDYIGQGLQQTFTPNDGTFSATRNYDGGVSIYFDGGLNWWNLDFASPMQTSFGVGDYEGATRFPFQSPTAPGLSVDGSGRGCNELTGRFVVLEAVFDAQGTVQRFAADFEQHCEGLPPALFGVVRYNSLNVPASFDQDGDGVIDVADNCPFIANPDQANQDGDEFGDVCDPFPNDPDNLGACLATHSLVDSDGDGVIDAVDACPNTTPGDDVDALGCSLAQFCAKVDVSSPRGKRACRHSDWKNDQPLMVVPSESDCVATRYRCVAAR